MSDGGLSADEIETMDEAWAYLVNLSGVVRAAAIQGNEESEKLDRITMGWAESAAEVGEKLRLIVNRLRAEAGEAPHP